MKNNADAAIFFRYEVIKIKKGKKKNDKEKYYS